MMPMVGFLCYTECLSRQIKANVDKNNKASIGYAINNLASDNACLFCLVFITRKHD